MKSKNKNKRVLIIIISLALAFICAVCCFNRTDTFKSKAAITDDELASVLYYYYDKSDIEEVELKMTESAEKFLTDVGEDEVIEVVYELDYEPYESDLKKDLNVDSSTEEVDAKIAQFRTEQRKYYLAKNREFLSEAGISSSSKDYEIIMSEYSPFIQVLFENVDAYEKNSEAILSTLDDVKTVSIGTPIDLESCADIAYTGNNYYMTNVLLDIGATSQTYTGVGINVGILEGEGVAFSSSHSELNNINITTGGSSIYNIHAAEVTRVFCGSNGIARGVSNLFLYHASNDSYLITALNWFINNNCSIINMSVELDVSQGSYHWTSAVLDYYVRFCFIACVNGAGNEGEKNNKTVTAFAMAYNTITVGATTDANKIASFSSHGTNNGFNSRKPTLVAPGAKIQAGNYESGTSYAAPIVSGIIAKLMQQYPVLKSYPEVVTASLIASATPVSGQESGWDMHAGAGRVNYAKAQEAVQNYYAFSFSSDGDSTIKCKKAISLQSNRTIKVASFWLANSRTTTNNGSFSTNIHTNYDVLLVEGDTTGLGAMMEGIMIGSFTVANSSSVTNIEYIKYNIVTQKSYTIYLNRNGSKLTTYADWGAFTWCYE